jgi:hypothetical protein
MAQRGSEREYAFSKLDRAPTIPNFSAMLLDRNSLTPRITPADWRTALLIAMLLTAATIAVHWSSPSKMQLSAEVWDKTYQYHQTLEAFRVRPITTNLIDAVSVVTGADFKTAFFGFQFAMFFISCLTFYWYLRQLVFSHRESLWGSTIFHLTVPVFLANFEPIHTWDDFWGYILIPLSIIALARRRFIVAALFMLVTILAREINLILVPVWFWLAFISDNRKVSRPLATVASAVVVFAAIRLILTGASAGDRDINLAFNFDGFLRTRDTIFSLLISNGFVWLTGLWAAWHVARSHDTMERFLGQAAIYSTILYVGTGVFFGFARESRYFTIPAVFLVPLTVLFFQKYRATLARMSQLLPQWWQKSAAMLALVTACVGVTKLVFPRFEYRPWHDGNWGFFALHLSVGVVVMAAIVGRRYEQKRDRVPEGSAIDG